MSKTGYIEVLARFSSGDAGLNELEDAVAAKLGELRTTPQVTDEQRLLSTVELMIEEAREGLREPLDVYIAVIQVLDSHSILANAHPASDTTEEIVPTDPKFAPAVVSTDLSDLRELVA